MAPYSGASEPCRQYGPSCCWRSHSMSHGGVVSRRTSHSSRQAGPRNAGSGGIAFMATWLTAYWLSSLTVTQPPM